MFKIIITIFLLLFSKSYAFETMAKQAIILDYDTNEILYKKNSNEKCFPSSMTKIMTAYIIFEKLDNGELKLNDKFTIFLYKSLGNLKISRKNHPILTSKLGICDNLLAK